MKAIQKDKAGWEIVGPAGGGGWRSKTKIGEREKKLERKMKKEKEKEGKKDSVTIKGLT